MPRYVPVMMNLQGRRCVLVGGGKVAERKAAPLLEAGAETVIVSPDVTPWLQALAEEGRIAWLNRRYEADDLDGAFLVYAATDDPAINVSVVREAERRGIPVNHAGEGERGSFITPSMIRRGGLVIAVSTSGAGPAASRELCREIDERYGSDYERYIDFLIDVRRTVKSRVTDMAERKRLFEALMEINILSAIRDGSFEPWTEEAIIAWIEENREERG